MSHARLLADPASCCGADGPTGVIWPNDRKVAELAPYVGRLALIALVFPVFKDGRAYSQARILREQYGFGGELRATGQVLRDQFLFMLRAGFDAFEVTKEADAAAFAETIRRYSVFYQPTGDGRPTVRHARSERADGRRIRWPKRPCRAAESAVACAPSIFASGPIIGRARPARARLGRPGKATREVRVTYVVNDNCIRCKFMDCVEVCPVDCFYEGENMLVIHPDECIDCGVCEPECPVDAIKPDTEPGLEKWLTRQRRIRQDTGPTSR